MNKEKTAETVGTVFDPRECIDAAIAALKVDAAAHEENARAVERLQDALVYLDNRDARLAAATSAPGI